jgi:DNA polymerase III subunit epsilon
MKLQLTKPLAFIDIESTGLDKELDRIIELSLIIEYPAEATGVPRFRKTRRINPGIPIPAASTEIHGIRDEDVSGMPMFKDIAQGLILKLSGCDLAGFGSNYFDWPILNNEFARCGILWDYSACNFIDVGNIFKIQEPRTLSAAVKFYHGVEHDGAHGADADCHATYLVFQSMLLRYPNLPDTIEGIGVFSNFGNKMLDLSGKFAYNEQGQIVFNFGPKRNLPAADHPDFVEWMLTKNFPADSQSVCYQVLASLNRDSHFD